MPLGLLVLHNQKDAPADFPYNQDIRRGTIVSLAMLCRGEFNFIIAAFSLSSGLLTPDIYSAVVLANLVAAIAGPLLLSKAIGYYNRLTLNYVSESHPVARDGQTCDGYRPLFLAIQARTPVTWGLQETFRKTLEECGLIIIDHRYWHTLGMDAVGVTEIFAQDKTMQVAVDGCFANSSREHELPAEETDKEQDRDESLEKSNDSEGRVKTVLKTLSDLSDDEEGMIQRRCDEIAAGRHVAPVHCP